MNMNNISGASRLADRFGHRIAARLSEGAGNLPHDITERLRVARRQALAKRKIPLAQPVFGLAWANTGSLGGEHPGLLARLAAALPIVLLAVGLVTISVLQSERRANEVAEVDAALLTDALPPSAYTDSGFLEYLKSGL
ncbi:MAG: DUF3619 family protein [Pseudomonadota bacterium]